MDICSSPRLFAAYHVLLRLSVPRHSPDALIRLTLAECSSDTTSSFLLYFNTYISKLFAFLDFFDSCFFIQFSRCRSFYLGCSDVLSHSRLYIIALLHHSVNNFFYFFEKNFYLAFTGLKHTYAIILKIIFNSIFPLNNASAIFEFSRDS